jgi:ABC-type glycerol-3-phosphate transport system substrate-binding protein
VTGTERSGKLSGKTAVITGARAAQAQRDITAGKNAMWFLVNVTFGQLRVSATDHGQDLGFFSIPGDGAKAHKVPISSTLYGITSKANVAASKKFIANMAAPANNNRYNKISGGISNSALAKGKLPEGNEAVRALAKRGLLSLWWINWPSLNGLPYLPSHSKRGSRDSGRRHRS